MVLQASIIGGGAEGDARMVLHALVMGEGLKGCQYGTAGLGYWGRG